MIRVTVFSGCSDIYVEDMYGVCRISLGSSTLYHTNLRILKLSSLFLKIESTKVQNQFLIDLDLVKLFNKVQNNFLTLIHHFNIFFTTVYITQDCNRSTDNSKTKIKSFFGKDLVKWNQIK